MLGREGHPRQQRRARPDLDAADPVHDAAGAGRSFGEQRPLGRAGQPAELAPVYVLLACDEALLRLRRPRGGHGRQADPGSRRMTIRSTRPHRGPGLPSTVSQDPEGSGDLITLAMPAMCSGRTRQQPPTSRAPAATQAGTSSSIPGRPGPRRGRRPPSPRRCSGRRPPACRRPRRGRAGPDDRRGRRAVDPDGDHRVDARPPSRTRLGALAAPGAGQRRRRRPPW